VVLFTLKFKVKRDKTDFANVFEIGNTITAPLGLTAADDRIGVIWNVENLSTGVAGVDGAAYKLHQNFPNPFRSETIIGFELPESEAAELTIFDQTGRVVHRTEGDFGKGFHQLKIQNRALGSPGVYYYRLTASKFNATRKMILE
ncbi:MAG TPA: T9SS type A sorting domain-containing protein, partial [Saprospiraceae bacterium]|nr:T9SS type A sorting domain-containing protein [Saprospiraceae bacterium]